MGFTEKKTKTKDLEIEGKFMIKKTNERISDLEYEKKIYLNTQSYLFNERDRIINTLKSLVDDSMSTFNDRDTDDFIKLNKVIDMINMLTTVNEKINELNGHISDADKTIELLKAQSASIKYCIEN